MACPAPVTNCRKHQVVAAVQPVVKKFTGLVEVAQTILAEIHAGVAGTLGGDDKKSLSSEFLIEVFSNKGPFESMF